MTGTVLCLTCQVWNCSNGSCLKHMAGDGYTEVTGVMHILEKSKFLSVGWNKRITTYLDEPDVSTSV